jgi:hypothetical protein
LVLRLRILFIFIVFFAAGTASAALVAPRDIYEGEITVAQQNPAERDALLSQAMGQVLIRVTGNRQVLAQKAAQDLQKEAVRYVQQFGYERRPAPPLALGAPVTVAPTLKPPVMPATIQVFTARFDATALNAQLRANGLAIWGRERPTTLVWLAVQSGGSRWLVNSDTVTTQAPALTQTAIARGLPLQLPNPPGVNTPDVLDIMQGVTERLLTISRSYGVSRTVLVRITQSGSQWNGSWTLVEDGQPQQTWQYPAATFDEAVAAGINQIADQYATRYAVSSTPGTPVQRGNVRLLVGGVQNLGEYARVSNYLSSLSPVTSVTLVDLTGSGAAYQVAIQGDRDALRQTIALGSVLEVDNTNTPSDLPMDGNTLRYRLKVNTP